MLSRRASEYLDEMVGRYGFRGVVTELSALAMRRARDIEKEEPHPEQHAYEIGRLVWAAEQLGRCAEQLEE
jgi:hypothetical protein